MTRGATHGAGLTHGAKSMRTMVPRAPEGNREQMLFEIERATQFSKPGPASSRLDPAVGHPRAQAESERRAAASTIVGRESPNLRTRAAA